MRLIQHQSQMDIRLACEEQKACFHYSTPLSHMKEIVSLRESTNGLPISEVFSPPL